MNLNDYLVISGVLLLITIFAVLLIILHHKRVRLIQHKPTTNFIAPMVFDEGFDSFFAEITNARIPAEK